MKKILLLFLVLSLCLSAKGQFYNVKSNGIGILTGTLNVGLEFSVNDKYSVSSTIYLNPLSGKNFQSRMLVFTTEARYWLYQSFSGPFISAGLLAGIYEVGNRTNYYKG